MEYIRSLFEIRSFAAMGHAASFNPVSGAVRFVPGFSEAGSSTATFMTNAGRSSDRGCIKKQKLLESDIYGW